MGKYAGFTGVRLGWTVVPKALKFSDGSPVWNDYNRIMSTGFNGASNLVQDGGAACLDDEGLQEIQTLIDYYLVNADMLMQTVTDLGYKAYGGVNAPYIFVDLEGKKSWDMFENTARGTGGDDTWCRLRTRWGGVSAPFRFLLS